MKKLIVLLALTIPLISCEPYYNNLQGYTYGQHLSLNEAWAKVSAMAYMRDTTGDYWKSPVEFYRDGGGDCEDFSGALMYELGEKASVAIVRMYGAYHMIVKWEGRYLEPQAQGLYYPTVNIVSTLNYADMMRNCTNGGAKVSK